MRRLSLAPAMQRPPKARKPVDKHAAIHAAARRATLPRPAPRLYGFRVAIPMHVAVQRGEIVEGAYEDGPVGGGVLRRQLALDAGGFP